MPVLQGGVGDFPGSLTPIFQRAHDVAFVRCEHPLLTVGSFSSSRSYTTRCATQHERISDSQPKFSGRAEVGAEPPRGPPGCVADGIVAVYPGRDQLSNG